MRQFFVSESAVNQNASINENSKNSNLKSLKQHTFAKSISLCCFCFCLVLRNRSFRHINLQISLASIQQDSQQDSHFDCSRIYFLSSHFFFCFRLYVSTSIAFATRLSTSIIIHHAFTFQSMNFFAISIDRRNEQSFRNETWRRRKNSVTSMFENFDWSFILSTRTHIELAWFETWRTIYFKTFRSLMYIFAL